jgi:hypothetical protein
MRFCNAFGRSAKELRLWAAHVWNGLVKVRRVWVPCSAGAVTDLTQADDGPNAAFRQIVVGPKLRHQDEPERFDLMPQAHV